MFKNICIYISGSIRNLITTFGYQIFWKFLVLQMCWENNYMNFQSFSGHFFHGMMEDLPERYWAFCYSLPLWKLLPEWLTHSRSPYVNSFPSCWLFEAFSLVDSSGQTYGNNIPWVLMYYVARIYKTIRSFHLWVFILEGHSSFIKMCSIWAVSFSQIHV